jgi:hypothetical protein
MTLTTPNPAIAPPNRVGPGSVIFGTITGPILADDWINFGATVTVGGNVVEAFGARHVLRGHTFFVFIANYGPTAEWPPVGGTVDFSFDAFHAGGGGAFDSLTVPAIGVLDYTSGLANLLSTVAPGEGALLPQILAAVTLKLPSLP